MTNTKHCHRCNKEFIFEEYAKHECLVRFKGVKTIVVDWIIKPKMDENGDMTHLVKGLDGIIYRIVHCLHNPPHDLSPSTESKHDKDYRQGNRT